MKSVVSKVSSLGPREARCALTAYCEENLRKATPRAYSLLLAEADVPFVLQQETDMSTKKTDQSPRLESQALSNQRHQNRID